ncbi:hypothetical protein J7E89_20360 [Streptomyces sp. ISL-100]|nr:hypothetical protein [Streptomyces sp. ISL-100]MBT2398260.1 hypothetical protein [Streptomyces sp. ISL-100]
MVKPPPLRQTVPAGFTIDDFHVDTDGRHRDPPGWTDRESGPPQGRRGPHHPVQTAAHRLPTARTQHHLEDRTGHQLHPQNGLLTAPASQAATDTAWQDEHRRWRPPAERPIGPPVAHGNRRARYRD